MTPQTWHEIGEDVVVCRQREMQSDCILAREMVLSKGVGMVRDRTYCIHLYEADELIDLVEKAGFEAVQVHADLSHPTCSEDVGCMNHRLVIAARKP